MITKDVLLNKVSSIIERYNMMDGNSSIPVAFSGGKDSALAIFLLHELGYDTKPVIIDRGDDSAFDSSKIKENLKEFGYDAKIINLRDNSYLDTICPFASNEIKKHIKKFDNLDESESHCTPCYNARTISLIEYALRLGSYCFVIGQHKTDMITSLLKCYWTEQYYNSFTKTRGIPYDGHRMKEFIRESEIDLDYLEKMVKKGRAATDDPPVEIIIDSIKLIRPLAEIGEREIKEYIEQLGFPYRSDNCIYREREPRPFRLLVQFDLNERIKINPQLEDILYSFVLMGLNEDGTLKFRPRNKREIFWPGFKPYIKKI